ncbi:hypothetical protein LSH36_481g00020 [Paralvinella palmiformis]|uniref:Battenin n=1 Tax=Paralvinella palmiformis TaxID=53620 RepID=A0AAD9MWX3_9ANNE|nr:hypothetical protein LSH36_481g00020 [Paralvinella palmiformis]
MEDADHHIQATPMMNCRNLVGFWLLGLCNNFAYVIMLSAAYDILKDNGPSHQNGTNASIIEPTVSPENNSDKLIPYCNKIGTGAILLADILPCLVIKLTAPWYIQSIPYGIRVMVVTVFAVVSFPVVAWSEFVWMSLLGVALTSASSGLGEITFLSLSTYYHNYFFILIQKTSFFKADRVKEEVKPLITEQNSNQINKLPLTKKFVLVRFELIYFENIWLSINQQYRWYQVLYQLGVLISRSSVNIVQIRPFWILSVLQFLNIGILVLQIFFRFIPSIWIIFVIILYEGLLGGATYVNAFYRISSEITPADYCEFSMGVASISDASGIAVAGAVAVPFHNFMCSL